MLTRVMQLAAIAAMTLDTSFLSSDVAEGPKLTLPTHYEKYLALQALVAAAAAANETGE